MGFGIAEVFAKKIGHWLVTGQYSMTPGLVEWYQSTYSLDHAEGISHYATCFSATTFVDERRSIGSSLADFKLKEFLILFSLDTPKIDLIQRI